MPPNVRTRQVIDDPAYTGYEVVIDVYPDVIAAGILLLPKNLRPTRSGPSSSASMDWKACRMDTITSTGRGIQALQVVRGESGEARVHRLCAAEPVSRRRSVSRDSAAIESDEVVAVQLHHSPARANARVASHACRMSIPSESASMASRTAAKRRCACRRFCPTVMRFAFARPTSTSGFART